MPAEAVRARGFPFAAELYDRVNLRQLNRPGRGENKICHRRPSSWPFRVRRVGRRNLRRRDARRSLFRLNLRL